MPAFIRSLFAGAVVTTASALTVLHAPSASAAEAVTRIGTSLAYTCYQAAEEHVPSRLGLSACDIALAEELLDHDDRARTLVNRGILRVLAHDFAGAQADYDQAIRMLPTLGDAWIDRGMLYVRQGSKQEAAIVEIDKGLAIGSKDPAVAYYGRALAYEALGKLNEAYRDYKAAAELKPDWDRPRKEMARFTVRPIEQTD